MDNTLNIVGCGKLGRTLGRLLQDCGQFAVNDVANRSPASAASAVAFIGSGRAADLDLVRPAAAWMIGTPDDEIEACCSRIAAGGLIAAGNVVFHCSGALGSGVLGAARDCGAAVASVHPVASFAEPLRMLARFAGTFCCIEGDAPACAVLAPAFHAIGGRVLQIDAAAKIIYHAGAVFASNYLVALLDVAASTMTAAGIPQSTAFELVRSLAQGSLDNTGKLGAAQALTGPIARGDLDLVKRQHAALADHDPAVAELYRQLALATARLAGRQLEF